MVQFLQQLSNGVVIGATYALIALGYTLVYGIIQLINFAHGEIFMVGAFGGLALYLYALPESLADESYMLPLVFLAAMVTSVVVAILVERFAYRPLRRAPRLAPLITAIGVSIFLQEAVRLYFPDAKSARPFPQYISTRNVGFNGVSLPIVAIFVIVVAILLMVALSAFIKTSKTGKAMRATSQDPDTARLMGVDTDKIIVITFAIGAALAGIAGVMQGLQFGQISFSIGFLAGIKAFTAAVLGGIGNVTGAVLGGFTLGIVEAMGTQYISSTYKDVFAFVVLILVLVFRPSGLLGERVATRS
ncbi:MAG TPA: branched-chain amino acid ABC transporter permease [Mycobacteriales bacterium]|nr:branched-chain amino acid ABC transporter permease [Mycobacteriales bacterium]